MNLTILVEGRRKVAQQPEIQKRNDVGWEVRCSGQTAKFEWLK